MELTELAGKRILFYGPAPTRDKEWLDPGKFDLVIITNNMVNLFFKKYGATEGVTLFANCLFCRSRHQDIKREKDNLSEIWVKGEQSRFIISHNTGFEKIRMLNPEIPGIVSPCGHALGLTVILNHIKEQNPNRIPTKLHISGVTYYSGTHERYEEGYKLEDGVPHDIPAEIKYLRNYIEEGHTEIEMCPELKEVLNDGE